jgi:excisionase family DNA binding protein
MLDPNRPLKGLAARPNGRTLKSNLTPGELGQTNESPLLSVNHAMALLNVGRTTFYQLLKDRELDVVKIYNSTRIPESSVRAFIARNTVAARRAA